jgi:hypothetical protein
MFVSQTALCFWKPGISQIKGTNGRGIAMKRKSPPKYDNTIGCVVLWAAVTRPDRRTAMKWLRLALRERKRKARLH